MAAAMLVADALGGQRLRLLWCVDLDRDVGPRMPPATRYLCAACSQSACSGECNGDQESCSACGSARCGLDVVSTPSGTVCSGGHGGAPWYSPPDDGRGGAWGALLTRLRNALDGYGVSEPPTTNPRAFECRIAVVVRENLPGAGPHVMTIGLPYRVDAAAVASAPPPVGCWRAWPLPPPAPGSLREREGDLPEDRLPLPSTFWSLGIPF